MIAALVHGNWQHEVLGRMRDSLAVVTGHTLIAVIGNSDVRVPAEATRHPAAAGLAGARSIGEALLNRYDTAAAVEYETPILPPIVRDLATGESRPDRIILIATDQPETTEAKYRASDTLAYAELVRRRLIAGQGIPDEAIAIEVYRENPADYAMTFPWLRERCAAWQAQAGSGPQLWHLAVTGGTPALTAALLIEGVAAFGAAARVHYLDRGATASRTIDVARDLQAQLLRRTLRVQIKTHAYAAALVLCEATSGPFAALLSDLLPDPVDQTLFIALVRHASERLNANLRDAELALEGVELMRLPDDERTAIAIARSSDTRARDAQTIREVIASARVMFELRHYFDFVTRVATFVDVCLKYVALYLLGVEVTKDAEQRDSVVPWVDQRPALRDHLQGLGTRYDGVPNQRVYRDIITFLAQGTAHEPLALALSQRRLQDLTALRNSSVHNFTRIRHKTLKDKWKADPETIIPALREIAAEAGIADVAHDPYAAAQRVLLRLLDRP